MKTPIFSALFALGIASATALMGAEPDPTITSRPPVSSDTLSTSALNLHQQTDRLFLGGDRNGDQTLTAVSATNPPSSEKDVMPAKNAATTEDTLALDPFEVSIGKVIVLPPTFHPTPQNFFRTGVLAQHESKKVTTYLWAKGDDGLMFTTTF